MCCDVFFKSNREAFPLPFLLVAWCFLFGLFNIPFVEGKAFSHLEAILLPRLVLQINQQKIHGHNVEAEDVIDSRKKNCSFTNYIMIHHNNTTYIILLL